MGDVAVEVDEFVRQVKAATDGRVTSPPPVEPLSRVVDDRRLQDHPGLDFAHRHWALPDQPDPSGHGRRSRLRRICDRLVFAAMRSYLRDERALMSHVVQLNDALAKRCDELAEAYRTLLDELDRRFVDTVTAQEHLARLLDPERQRPGAGGG